MPSYPVDEHSILEKARQIDSQEVLADYLLKACGDDAELLARIRLRLENAHCEPLDKNATRADSALILSGSEADDASSSVPESTSSTMSLEAGAIVAGRYKLLESIGEGGMGTVWVAEQSEPVKRQVAIKLIKAGMDSNQVLARFDAERQALAVMDHPNIAKVLDGGITEQGRPYFVMEYVKGVPITRYCDQVRLPVKERLGLFKQVCHAVQHAHQKGIIHRDLKPSNILVGLSDGKPSPKVIDFGLAKAMHQSLTEQTLFTAQGLVLGTPMYMSPEQADPGRLDIDTRTDIYSLGVILYELLTGSTPLKRDQLKTAAAGEIVRLIKEVEPLKPSSRISGNDTLPSVATQRGIDLTRLKRDVSGDLDWVVMKALEKERTRRYETANGLAADIQRHLDNEPVSAGPPSTRYRMRKFVARNRVAVIAASIVAVALVLGIVGTSVGMAWAIKEKSRADNEATRAKSETARASIAERKAETQRQQAEANFQQAMSAVEQMLTRVGNDKLANVPLMEDVRRELLEDALQFYLEFLEQRGSDRVVQVETAKAYLRVGEINRLLARNTKAENSFVKSRQAFERLIDEFPSEPNHRSDLASCCFEYGVLLAKLGRGKEAEESFTIARNHLEKLHAEFPENPIFQARLSRTCNAVAIMWREKRPEEAEALVRRAIRLRLDLQQRDGPNPQNTHRLAQMHVSLGGLVITLKGRDAAAPVYLEAARLMQTLMASEPNLPVYRKTLINAYTGLGRANRYRDPDEAERNYRLAAKLQGELSRDFPQVVQHRADLASNYNNLALILKARHRYDDAKEAYMQSAAIREKLSAEFPEAPDYQRALARLYGNFARLPSLGQAEAETIAGKAVNVARQLLRKFPDDPINQEGLARAYNRLGGAIAATDPQRAEAEFERAIALHLQLIAKSPQRPEPRFELIRCRHSIAWSLANSPEPQRGSRQYQVAIKELEQLVHDHPDRTSYERELADIYNNFAWLLATSSKSEVADSALAERFARKAIGIKPTNGGFHTTLGAAKYYAGEWAAAIESLDEANRLNSTIAARPFLLAMAHWQLGNRKPAEDWLQRGIDEGKLDETSRFRREATALIRGD